MTMKPKLHSGDSLLAEMRCPQYLTFDAAMTALRRMGDASDNKLWPTLSGNEIMAFANAAIDEYLRLTTPTKGD
jgi:phage terminase small subunit